MTAPIVLHLVSRQVEVDGRRLELPSPLWEMLSVLADGKVVPRAELARAARVQDLSPRRCESLLVELRRQIGTERIRNRRRRGWMLTVAADVLDD